MILWVDLYQTKYHKYILWHIIIIWKSRSKVKAINVKKASNVARDRFSPNQSNIYLTPSDLTFSGRAYTRHGLVQPMD